MTIGFYAPLPPTRSGVAGYAAALLAHMPSAVANQPGDVNLYHLGNNPLHREIYARAISQPGVALLHDAVLQHFFLGILSEAQYVEEFVYNYGEWSRDLGGDLWRNRARSGVDSRYFEYPMLRRVVEVSKVIVVHNPAAGAIVEKNLVSGVVHPSPLQNTTDLKQSLTSAPLRSRLGRNPPAVTHNAASAPSPGARAGRSRLGSGASDLEENEVSAPLRSRFGKDISDLAEGAAKGTQIVEIPHLFEPPLEMPADHEITRLRERLGLGPRTFLFGVFGYLRESKRLMTILRAFGAARVAGADIALLVAGEFVSDELARALAPSLSQPHIATVGHLSERGFWLHASAVDACLNLRYPTAGETSGIGVRLMGIGKPVFFTRGEEVARLPEPACLRIDPGAEEVDMLTGMIVWLARFPEHAREIGHRAAAHIREFHAPDRCARAFEEACAL